MIKSLQFNLEQIKDVSRRYSTPFYLYDENGIINNAKKFKEAFSWARGFKNYYALKACPNPSILLLLNKNAGFGSDCSSLAELELSSRCGITGTDIMFTSNNTHISEYFKAEELGAIINLDDISHIEYLEQGLGKLPDMLSFRYNPGVDKTGNDIIGTPLEAKYGLTREQMFDAYEMARDKGVKRFGIHTMVASNELNEDYFAETATVIFKLMSDIHVKLGINFDFVNLGGGIGIPYYPDSSAVNIDKLSHLIKDAYDKELFKIKIKPKLYMECGRYITGPYGYLITQVIHFKNTYKEYVGVDATMADLMRPGIYGAYHHIVCLGKEKHKEDHIYDVVGSLCENNDKFAINRNLPRLDKGDYLVICDAGAHGRAMGFNYNGKLRPAELLLRKDGSVKMIRRAETLADLFATLSF